MKTSENGMLKFSIDFDAELHFSSSSMREIKELRQTGGFHFISTRIIPKSKCLIKIIMSLHQRE